VRPLVRSLIGGLLFLLGQAGPAIGQGLGASIGVGLYSHSASAASGVGVAFEGMGRIAWRSGLVVGLGGRYYARSGQEWHRGAISLDVRYAPGGGPASRTRRVNPVVGIRGGPFVISGGSEDLLIGYEAGRVLGIGIPLGPGVSLTLTGDVVVRLTSDDYNGRLRRALPGLQLGLVIH